MQSHRHVLSAFPLIASLILSGCQPTGSIPDKGQQQAKADRSTASKKTTPVTTPKSTAKTEVPQDAYQDVTEAIAALIEAAKTSDTRAFERAETWLVRQGAPAVDPLAQILNDEQADMVMRIAVCRPLRKLGPPAIPVFKRALESSSLLVQLNAIKGLGSIRPAGADSISTLGGLLDAEQDRVRREAILALANIGPPAKEACAGRLIALLNDTEENETLRDAAKRALEEISPRRTFGD
jgi:HEAT repeat protein